MKEFRDPSIHIKLSTLKKILSEYEEGDDIAMEILKRGKSRAVPHRGLIDFKHKSTPKIVSSANEDAYLFSEVLINFRKSLKHRGLDKVIPGHRDWLTVKSLTELANRFAEEFDLPKRQAYIEFLRVASGKMQRFVLNKISGMFESICNTYEAVEEINLDNSKDNTIELVNYYKASLLETTGFCPDYTLLPDKYVYFVRAKKLADKLNVTYKLFIKAQFDQMYDERIPDPVQLVGEKAVLRVQNFMANNRERLKRK